MTLFIEAISKTRRYVIMALFVIPVQTGIQFFRALLDARFRGHDSVLTQNLFLRWVLIMLFIHLALLCPFDGSYLLEVFIPTFRA